MLSASNVPAARLLTRLALFLVALALLWTEEARAAGAGGGLQALVLWRGSDESMASQWQDNWSRLLTSGVVPLEAEDASLLVRRGRGTYEVVVGHCPAAEVPARLALLRAVQPRASARAETGSDTLPCPRPVAGASSVLRHEVRRQGWRLVVSGFRLLEEAAPQRRQLEVAGVLFDPDGAITEHYRSSQDADLRWPGLEAKDVVCEPERSRAQGRDVAVLVGCKWSEGAPAGRTPSRITERLILRLGGSGAEDGELLVNTYLMFPEQ